MISPCESSDGFCQILPMMLTTLQSTIQNWMKEAKNYVFTTVSDITNPIAAMFLMYV